MKGNIDKISIICISTQACNAVPIATTFYNKEVTISQINKVHLPCKIDV